MAVVRQVNWVERNVAQKMAIPLSMPKSYPHKLVLRPVNRYGGAMAIPKNEFSLEPLTQAAHSLKQAIKQPKNEFIRDAVIQRFEYTFELAWKSLKRYFEINNGKSEFNLKDLFREAGKQGLIDSVEDWFGYQKARNNTSHTYNVKTAEETYQAALKFSTDVEKLIAQLKSKLD